ncbi:motility associated factor glycosyltransferase family protein [Pseudoalteromonas spongiae]|uniref:motility associated factor glycosyltransferase family protein n=1 Tax=Pseudoalteromonas spongiae TaxID=298657 RepID=UPI00110A4DFB|nr:6-hydroxymethylpterin diphosphokinase MptE-like protein [Pseudoalteromonas spongiae]TMO83676.1 septum formation inhibitor Maf [Pseudoalteromonas spongiae]
MDNLEQLLEEAEKQLDTARAHQLREQKFALEANQRFENNLTAFKKYYPQIYKEITQIKLRDDFCIHVTESGHGNFFMQGKGVPLYGNNPIEQVKAQVDKYTKSANFSRTNYFDTQEWESNDERIHVRYMHKLVRSLHFQEDNKLPCLTELPENFPTCLIFGIGLGYHIPQLLEKHQFDYLFICEPDLELFYASLFCINWFSIIEQIDKQNGCLFLHLGVSYEDFFSQVFAIGEDIGAFSIINSFCYQHYPSDDVNKMIKSFFDNYYQVHQGFGFYNDAITGLSHALHNVNQKANFLMSSAITRDAIQDVPVFVVGNGPSLDKAIPVLKKYQNQAIILAAGTAFQSLCKAGIKADFHVLVERPKITYDIQLDIAPEDGYSDVNLLAVDVIYPDLLPLYKWVGLGLKGPEASSALLQRESTLKYGRSIVNLPCCGPMVSNTASSFAACLGFKDIYLFGVDNGYLESGETHSKLSIYNDDNFKARFKTLQGANIEFEANLTQKVKATSLMAMSKSMFDKLVRALPNTNFYNVGEGAKINGAIPLTEENVYLESRELDKESVIDEIKVGHFRTLELDNLEEKIDFDEYESLCDYLIEIGERSYTNREEAHEVLKAQQRLVYAYKKSKHRHLFHMLKGTLLYFHCPLVTLLYYYQDEQYTLAKFSECMNIWQEFLSKVKFDFRLNYLEKCDYTKDEYKRGE